MKKYNTSSFVFALTILILGTNISEASAPPVMTLSNNGSSVQVVVSNADPNAAVTFYYKSGSSSDHSSVNIGSTNSSGYLSTSINAGSYSLTTGNPVYVVVDGVYSANQAWPSLANSNSATMTLSQPTATLTIGQSTVINAYNVSGTLSVPGNTNSAVVSTSVNGNSLVLNGLSAGTSIITICASNSGCGSINVTVQPSDLSTPGVYLSPNSLTINTGQSQTVSITGYASAPYYVSNNSGSSYVSTAINGNSLIITGLALGTSNITVCATSGQCGTTFVNVSGNGNTTTAVSGQSPAVSSMTISSNSANGSFIGTGNVISVSFSANQTINNPIVIIGGTQVNANGSGSGPYVSTYFITGHESMPIPVAISFANSSGVSGQSYFWLGNSSTAPANTTSSSNTTTTINPTACPANLTCVPNASTATTASSASVSSYSFSNYLYSGMTKLNVSNPDVTALQERLLKDGFFSGPVTGYFGPVTKAAVEAYQKAHGLDAIGVVGPGTRNLLNQGI